MGRKNKTKKLILILLLICPTQQFVESYLLNRCGEDCLRIARCESNLIYNAKNPNSSATGLYQYIKSTWDYVGGGDIYDIELQTDYFIKYYSKYPSWWECK